ncbi:hypothetical protein JHK87_018842 [Glycine soja]|nr:hypothetical protein JHK87_018842 [Glycine soja]
MLQLLTCVHFNGYLVISASHFQAVGCSTYCYSFCFVDVGFCCGDFVSSMHAVFGEKCCLFSVVAEAVFCPFEVINAECWMVLHLLCFFPLFCMQPILSSLAGIFIPVRAALCSAYEVVPEGTFCPLVRLFASSPFLLLTLALLCSAYEVYSFQSVRLCVLHMRFYFCCLSFLCFVLREVGGVESPLKSEAFCSSLMHFLSAFGGSICQVINGALIPMSSTLCSSYKIRLSNYFWLLQDGIDAWSAILRSLCASDNRRWRTPKASIDVSASKGSVVAQRTSII